MIRKILTAFWVLLLLAGVFLLLSNFSYFRQQAAFLFFTPSKEASLKHPQNPKQGKPDYLAIPTLGISAPVVYVSGVSEAVFQDALKNGVVHYPGTALPGREGNCYIFGHSSDYAWAKGAYKTVFALLPKIQKGDEVEISDREGKVFVYRVSETFVARPQDVHLLEQDKSKKILTLQTSYPIGTALRRYIVRANLVE